MFVLFLDLRVVKMNKSMPVEAPPGTWVQTERAAHEAWSKLIAASPLAARIMHVLASKVGDNNAVVISQGTLAKLLGAHRRSVTRAIALLESDRWIEVRQIGDRGTVNAYVLNDRVIWHGPRDGLRYSLFSAAVVVSSEEQPDNEDLGAQPPLRRLPTLYPGERQLPTGDGLPPPTQPSFPGLEPDLPARRHDPETGEVE
jgi:DNA-binding transcriptional MocR family regulator